MRSINWPWPHAVTNPSAFLKICSFFHWSKRQQDQPDQPLPVQRRADPAEESTLKMPDRLTSLGSQSYGWKNGYLSIAYFYHFVHYLKSAVFPLFHWPKRQQINQARLSLYNAERIRPRSPPWAHLTGCPALGVNPGWKNGYLSSYISIIWCFLGLANNRISLHAVRRSESGL